MRQFTSEDNYTYQETALKSHDKKTNIMHQHSYQTKQESRSEGCESVPVGSHQIFFQAHQVDYDGGEDETRQEHDRVETSVTWWMAEEIHK